MTEGGRERRIQRGGGRGENRQRVGIREQEGRCVGELLRERGGKKRRGGGGGGVCVESRAKKAG